MIPQLHDVTVVADHHYNSATFEVLPAGSNTPVLRLHKDHVFTSRHPFMAFVGPGLDELAGWVTHLEAMGADRVKHGKVEHKESAFFTKQTWTFEQRGLPTLTGTPQGIADKLRYGTPLGFMGVSRLLDPGLGYHIGFRGPGSEGFDFARLKGLNSRFTLNIHDQRVSPLLALAAIVRYDRRMDLNPKSAAIDYFRLHTLDD